MSEIQFKEYEKLVYNRAWAVQRRYPSVPIDDVIGHAHVVYCEALRRYDPSRSSFTTFLWFCLMKELPQYCGGYFGSKKGLGTVVQEPVPVEDGEAFLDLVPEPERDPGKEQILFTAQYRLKEGLNLDQEAPRTLYKDALRILHWILSFEWPKSANGCEFLPSCTLAQQVFSGKLTGERVLRAWNHLKSAWQEEAFA